MEQTQAVKNKPAKSFYNRGINVAVWNNKGDYTFSIRKTYKAPDGSWKVTTTLFPEDMANLQDLIGQALAFRHEVMALELNSNAVQTKQAEQATKK